MLPEQVWDKDRPELGMRLGYPTGAALPLAWAHAEYIALLRSCADGVVFDLIEPVVARYLAGRGRKDLEIWNPLHQVRKIRRGDMLRIQAPAAFRLRSTRDEWQTQTDTTAIDSGIGLHFVDLAVPSEQCLPLVFTFFWLESADTLNFKRGRDSWEGTDYIVQVY
jgi:glucoamylase